MPVKKFTGSLSWQTLLTIFVGIWEGPFGCSTFSLLPYGDGGGGSGLFISARGGGGGGDR